MKKQMACYKEEIENMKKMEAHMTVSFFVLFYLNIKFRLKIIKN
jgi:hypothetical protein